MMQEALAAYLERFSMLHRNVTKVKGAAPHKPILLLAIFQEINAGRSAMGGALPTTYGHFSPRVTRGRFCGATY
ncbi:hypothetical protein [Armatimonas sp.]|uniref:hypothetical protein n=1 Tax=Armatimonas sp. TaxID=1872638 RepID=UPI0037507C07